ncbi:hypothetical protein DPMN_043577 [Dreissena polymorpha]|uniref:RNase H type-1 domain-containing protein n=1 Tax=Dreissena polymorpha TaxID=45954 RepID=A0A9D4D301_DREPO|nr:hypothetical protein DPMN_043577 [Dreissena polymorpha]
MSSLESIKNRNSRYRPDILTDILELHQQCLDKSFKVTLVWCPADVNISGNEQADRGAKEGLLRGAVDAREPLAPTEIYSPRVCTDLEKCLKIKFYLEKCLQK